MYIYICINQYVIIMYRSVLFKRVINPFFFFRKLFWRGAKEVVHIISGTSETRIHGLIWSDVGSRLIIWPKNVEMKLQGTLQHKGIVYFREKVQKGFERRQDDWSAWKDMDIKIFTLHFWI